jgi:hypothetical protein
MTSRLRKRFNWLGVVLFSMFLVIGAFSSVAMADKRANLLGMRGVAYSPTPTDYVPGKPIYNDSDFFNDDFTALWGEDDLAGYSREDIKEMSLLGVEYIRLYDWNTPSQRSHIPFLNECNKYGIKVLVPISNYFVGLYDQGQDQSSQADGFIKDIVNELVTSGKIHPAVAMITVANEPQLNSKSTSAVVSAIVAVVRAQEQLGVTDMLPISVPEDFGVYNGPAPGIQRLQEVRDAIGANTYLSGKNFLTTMYVAAMNTANPGTDLTSWLQGAFPTAFPDDYVFFSEMGSDEITQGSQVGQATFDIAAWKAATGSSNKKALGGCIFSYTDQTWKQGTEGAFGMNTKTQSSNVAKTRSGQQYPVDTLTPKTVLTKFKDLWKGSPVPRLTHTEQGRESRAGAPSASYKVHASAHERSAVGSNAEWYLIHITPLGEIYQFETGGSWVLVDTITPSATISILTFNDAIVYDGELTKGTHIFILAIDPFVNGTKDTDHWEVAIEIIEVE